MAAALRLAQRGLGRTWPNPSVGALVVDDSGRVLGAARTADGGRPHAEPIALDQAAEMAVGATLYVTLEPCAHFGQTPPCTDRIVESGVRRVVCGTVDPDDRVAGQGLDRLKQAGIEVEVGILNDMARRASIGHISRVKLGRPHTLLKMAVSRDGMIAGAGNRQIGITGQLAGRWVHRMRAQSDAIMVGVGTVLADDPDLTCRLPGAEQLSPVRVIVDTEVKLPSVSRLAQSAELTPTWILAGRTIGSTKCDERRAALVALNVRIIDCERNKNGQIDLHDALSRLADEGITRLMIEGGAHLARSLIDAELVDDIALFSGPDVIGVDGLKAFVDVGPELIVQNDDYLPTERVELERDMLSMYRHKK